MAANSAADAKGKNYTPTPFEAEAMAAYRDASPRRGPRLRLKSDGANSVKVGVDHPEQAIGQIALMHVIGTTNAEFYNGLLGHIINASKESAPSEAGANFTTSTRQIESNPTPITIGESHLVAGGIS